MVNISGLNIVRSLGLSAIWQIKHVGVKHHGTVAASAKTVPICLFYASLAEWLLLGSLPSVARYPSPSYAKIETLNIICQ